MPTDAALEDFHASVREIAHDLNTNWNAADLNEAAVRQVIVLRLLQAAGFDIWNPLEVMPEVRSGKRGNADFLIRIEGKDAFVLELKRLNAVLADDETEQAITYAFHKSIRWAIITNGKIWKVCDTHIKTEKFNERIILEINLDDTDSFANSLYALLNRSIWISEKFEKSLKAIKSLIISKELNKKLELFMDRHQIANRSSAINFMAKEDGLTEAERNVLEENQNFSQPKSAKNPDSDLLHAINSSSGKHINDATGSFVAQWSGTTIKPKSFRNLYLSLVEVAISRDIDVTSLYATPDQIQNRPANRFAELSNGQKVNKNLSAASSRTLIRKVLKALKVRDGTLEILYTGETYFLP